MKSLPNNKKKSWLIIASLIFIIINIIVSLISVILFLTFSYIYFFGVFIALLAIICGHFARSKIKKGAMIAGNKLALFGLIISYIYIIVFVFLVCFDYIMGQYWDLNYRVYDMRTIVSYCKEDTIKNNGNIPKDLPTLMNTPNILIGSTTIENYKLNISGNVKDYPDKSNTVMIIEVTPKTRGDKIVAFLDGRIEIIDYNKFLQLTNYNNKVKCKTED
jgi:hypothetical protein